MTVVPAPGRLAIAARPPAASIRPVIDSRMPRRDGGVADGSNPRPRSVILTTAQPAPPVTVTSAAVSSVTSYPQQTGPAAYGFVVAFPAVEVAALTAVITQAYDSGDALGMSVAGKLWQAPQPRHEADALRAERVNLLSRTQAQQLHRLLVGLDP